MLLVVKLAEEKAALTRQVAERDAVIVGLRATLTTLEGTIAALQTSLINHANDVALSAAGSTGRRVSAAAPRSCSCCWARS